MGEITMICCACLVEATNETEVVQLCLIYDEENGLTYGDCLRICTNIEVDDGILCNDCSQELEISFKFLRKVTKSQAILNEIKEEPVDVFEVDTNQLQEEQDENIVEEIIEETEEWLTEAEIGFQEEGTIEQEEQQPAVSFENDSENEEIEGNENAKVYAQNVETNSTESSNFDEIIEEVSVEEEIITTPKNIKLHALLESNTTSEESLPLSDEETKPRKRFFGKFDCKFCGKMFPNHSRMVIHRRTHEKTHSAYNCKLCGKMYASDQALSVHIRTTHNEEGLKCAVCSKVFPTKQTYEVHMRYHTKELPFHCGICDKYFAQKSHLNSHRNLHNGLRFICVQPNCGKLFTSSPALREHEFTHTVMPFECKFCHGGYPSKSKLKTHLRKVHSMEFSLEDLETMREFHTMRSKPNVIKLEETTT